MIRKLLGFVLIGIFTAATLTAPAIAETPTTQSKWQLVVKGRSGEIADVLIKFNSKILVDKSAAALPVEKVVFRNHGFAEIVVTRTDGITGPISCEIWFDGVMMDFAYTEDPNAVVPCSFSTGQLPK